MKTNFSKFRVLAVSLSLSLLISCSKDEETLKLTKQIADYDNPMKSIGDLHNKGLDFVLERLKSTPMTRTSAEINIVPLVVEFVTEAYSDLPKAEMNIVREALPPIIEEYSLVKNFSDFKLTKNQKYFIDQLEEIISDDDFDLISLRNRIIQLEEEANNTLTGEDLNVILAGTSVAFYTLGYWHDNYEAWDINGTSNQMAGGFNWKQLGKHDVGGGVAAASGGGLTWLLLGTGPSGWGAWGALVLGGAVASSIEDCIDQLWSTYDIDIYDPNDVKNDYSKDVDDIKNNQSLSQQP